MMHKVNNVKMAREIAGEEGLHFGMSALDGKWYVGTIEELKKIGCTNIDTSEGKMEKQPKVIRDLYEKGIWATRDTLFDKLRAGKKLREQEEEDPRSAGPGSAGPKTGGPAPAGPGKGAPPDVISQIQGTLQKFGVKSARSFLGWDLTGGLADDRSFLSLGVKEEGFCLRAKSGAYTVQEATEAQTRLGDILACLKELEGIAPNLVAK